MLSYRHIYHAGNFADVVKHIALVALLQAIMRKPTPCYVHDSHAGRGVYALDSAEAIQHREFESGIGRIWSRVEAPDAITQYLEIVREYNPGLPIPRNYPGSPAIVRALMRQQDRLLLTELHPRDYAELVHSFAKDRRIQIHKLDAYQGLKAFLPPAERRGMILIDPPYERKDEYTRVITGLKAGYARWHQGIYAIWYPIMSRGLQTRFLQDFIATGIRKILHIEFLIAPHRSERQFVGCGLVLVNPPWRIETTLESCLLWLREPLRQDNDVSTRVSWLVPE